MIDHKRIQAMEKVISYVFQDKKLLMGAIMHSSYTNEKHMGKTMNNERLEFLGDAVLELVTSEFLFLDHKRMLEGDLTKLRASIVCEHTLSFCAKEIALGDYLLLGKGEESTGGRTRNSILSDALEAVIGAIYIDGGFANAKEFINRCILSDIDRKQLFFDSKTIFQEMIQGENREPIHYELIGESGPDHNKQFHVKVYVGDKEFGEGTGHTKKSAEQEAAYHAILDLKDKGTDVRKGNSGVCI